MPNSTSPFVFEKSPLRAYSSKGLVLWGLERTFYHAKLVIGNLSSQLPDFRLPKNLQILCLQDFCRFSGVSTLLRYSFLLVLDSRLAKIRAEFTEFTLLLSGVLNVHNNRGFYFLYYKLPPARCLLVLLCSLKERSFKTSIAVQRHLTLKYISFM